MLKYKSLMAGVVLATALFAGAQAAEALPIINVTQDSGQLTTSTHPPAASTSVSTIASPYGSGGVTITPVVSGWKVTFNPTAAFGVSANNLAGGKTQTFAGLIAFDITFDAPINLTANVFEDGIYSRSGNGRVGVNAPDTSAGIQITALDGPAETKGNDFLTHAIVNFGTPPSGVWSLYDQVTGFGTTHTKYHVVVDNDLLAETLAGAPSFAAVAKKNFSIVFTTDGSSGGGPIVPEPASLTMLGAGAALLLTRRRK